MKADDIYSSLEPFRLLSRKGLSPIYRVLHCTPEKVSGCATFGQMEIEIDMGLSEPIFVYTDNFLALLRSLPAQEVTFTCVGHALEWECGKAKGKISCVEDIEMPSFEWKQPHTALAKDFAKRLDSIDLGLSSTLLSVGVYGFTFENGHDLRAYCSDTISIASVKLAETIAKSPDKLTLNPEAVKLLMKMIRNEPKIIFDDTSVYLETDDAKLILKQIPKLKHDIKALASDFTEHKITAPLNSDVIGAFMRRADALAEDKNNTHIFISLDKGAVALRFEDERSMSEESYEAETNVVTKPVKVQVSALVKALPYASEMVFDYAEKGVFVLRGDNDFFYAISGSAA